MDDKNKQKDANYWFSVTMLVISIIGLVISGFMARKKWKGDALVQGIEASAAAGSQATLGNNSTPGGIARALEQRSENLATNAKHASEGAAAAYQFQNALNKIKGK